MYQPCSKLQIKCPLDLAEHKLFYEADLRSWELQVPGLWGKPTNAGPSTWLHHLGLAPSCSRLPCGTLTLSKPWMHLKDTHIWEMSK